MRRLRAWTLVAALLVAGCSSLGPAKAASNALDAALVKHAGPLEERCLDPYDPAALPTDPATRVSEADRLRKAYQLSGCPRELRIYEDARSIHQAIHATIGAIEAGECAGKSRLADDCDLQGAILKATRATATIAARAKALGGGK